MTTAIAPPNMEPSVEPRYHGYWVQRKWYCDCRLEAKCRQVTKEGSEHLGKKFWSCPRKDRSDQCGMFTLDEDVSKAKDWLFEYGPEIPDLDTFQKSKRARPTSPRTPPAKLGINVNPFTRARSKKKRSLPNESSDEWQIVNPQDNGEGRAPPEEEVTTILEGEPTSSSSSRQDDSDPPVAKRIRYSPTTPVPDAPKKKTAHVSFATPTAPSRATTRNLKGAFEAAKRNDAQRVLESPHPVDSLPIPETGHRVKDFRIYEDKEEPAKHSRTDEITSSLLAQLSSPINLDDMDSELGSGNDTPTKRSRTSRASRGTSTAGPTDKGKGKAQSPSNQTSQDLITAIMSILRSEGHTLKASTRYQIEHEIESVLDIKDAQIRSGDRTIGKLKREIDQFEDTVELLTGSATVNGVIELSD